MLPPILFKDNIANTFANTLINISANINTPFIKYIKNHFKVIGNVTVSIFNNFNDWLVTYIILKKVPKSKCLAYNKLMQIDKCRFAEC